MAYTEPEIILPAILAMRGLCDRNGYLSTTDLKAELMNNVLTLDKYDKEILNSGFSMRIEQIIRNLKSNIAFINTNLVTCHKDGFKLTRYGKNLSDDGIKQMLAHKAQRALPIKPSEKSSNELSNQEVIRKFKKHLKNNGIEFTFEGNFKIIKKVRDLEEFSDDATRIVAIQQLLNDIIDYTPELVTTKRNIIKQPTLDMSKNTYSEGGEITKTINTHHRNAKLPRDFKTWVEYEFGYQFCFATGLSAQPGMIFDACHIGEGNRLSDKGITERDFGDIILLTKTMHGIVDELKLHTLEEAQAHTRTHSTESYDEALMDEVLKWHNAFRKN